MNIFKLCWLHKSCSNRNASRQLFLKVNNIDESIISLWISVFYLIFKFILIRFNMFLFPSRTILLQLQVIIFLHKIFKFFAQDIFVMRSSYFWHESLHNIFCMKSSYFWHESTPILLSFAPRLNLLNICSWNI